MVLPLALLGSRSPYEICIILFNMSGESWSNPRELDSSRYTNRHKYHYHTLRRILDLVNKERRRLDSIPCCSFSFVLCPDIVQKIGFMFSAFFRKLSNNTAKSRPTDHICSIVCSLCPLLCSDLSLFVIILFISCGYSGEALKFV